MNKRGLLLVFFTAIISGVSIFINKYSVSMINPYIFTGLKNVSVALFLSGLLLLTKNWPRLKHLTKKQWILLIIIGLVGGSIPFLLFFKGLSLTLAAQGSFIHKTMFIYVLILAAIFLKEKINKEFLIGALLLLFGNLLLLKKLSISFGWGDFLIFSATILWAIENIISKYALKDLLGTTVAWARMFFGSIFILGYLGLNGQLSLISSLTLQQVGWVAVTSLLLFGYVFTWYNGLKYIPVSVATAVLMIGSPITTLLSLVSGSQVDFKEITAAILILSGVIFVLNGVKHLVKQIKQVTKKIYVRA